MYSSAEECFILILPVSATVPEIFLQTKTSLNVWLSARKILILAFLACDQNYNHKPSTILIQIFNMAWMLHSSVSDI